MVQSFMRSLWGKEVSSELKAAHRSWATGDYGSAADQYQKLALAAEKQLSPHAPWLYLQAARSCISVGDLPRAMKYLERGLSLLISAGSDDTAYLLSHQFLNQLSALGREDEAQELVEYLRFGLPGYSVSAVPRNVNTGQLLPTQCPTCEGPIRLIEVRWKDSQTAECPYCGNLVRVLQKVRA
jgi:tetratricopeptide (TPR) repeat protein